MIICLPKKFSVGVFFAHSTSEGRPELLVDGLIGQWENNYSEVGARFGFHFTQIDNWDIYGGPTIALAHSKINPVQENFGDLERHRGIKPVQNDFLMGVFLGVRHVIKTKVILFSEIGIGATLFKVGVGYKLL